MKRNKSPESVSSPTPSAQRAEARRKRDIDAQERERKLPVLSARDPRYRPLEDYRVTLPELLVSKLPTAVDRDAARAVLHGVARTGNTLLKFLDIPNRVFGNSRSVLQDIYEKSEANLAKDAYENKGAVPQIAETAVHLASSGVVGRALPAVFGANVGADTYETAKYAGASEGEALAKGIGPGVVDTAIWTLGQGLASKYLPKAWQWLGRELTGAMRGAASSVTSDAMLNSLGADISGEEMAERAVHAAWMVPLLGMLKMGGKRREEAMSLLRKARPDLAGAKADKVIETIEAEFSDPKSQKVALAWVARKGANLPDDTAQIRQALEVSSKVKGLDPMSRSPFEILSDPAYARYLPKPKPQDVKAFSNMKHYPMGVIGFDVSDDAAGRQATREMINAYMSPSSNPWCLATGKGAAKLGELGPEAEGYWKSHSAVPKQIFFQEVDGKLELTAFRATSPEGEGQQEYWDTSDAGYSGIPLKVKVPGDPMGRYRKLVFRPDTEEPGIVTFHDVNGHEYPVAMTDARAVAEGDPRVTSRLDPRDVEAIREAYQRRTTGQKRSDEVQGSFEDIAPGKIFKGDPFHDGRSQTWVRVPESPVPEGGLKQPYVIGPGAGTSARTVEDAIADRDRLIRLRDRAPVDEWDGWGREIDRVDRAIKEYQRPPRAQDNYTLVEDKVRTTENGITKFRTTKYANPTDWDYDPPKPGEQSKPVEIEESELVSPEWMRSRGYDPESESDVRRMYQELNIRGWGDGAEAAMAIVPTKRTYVRTMSGTPETVTYGSNGRDVVSVDFTKDGVPYREEYFHSGPADADPSSIYHTMNFNDFPHPTTDIGINEPSGFRLVREPEGEFPAVLDEVRWDEGLGGFVRTSGNRRWRENPDRYALPTRREYESVAAYNLRTAALRNSMRAREGYSDILIEDRQPDGTWAPAVDRFIDAETGGMVELPPLPPAIRSPDTQVDNENLPFALKAGRTRRDIRAASKAGDTEGPEAPVEEPVPQAAEPVPEGGPRIVINPSTFRNKKDALCVAWNERLRIWMEDNDFRPRSEPTQEQREFFSDTPYGNDELQMRRTILARIATLDTSIENPTDMQLGETAEMLRGFAQTETPSNDYEAKSLARLIELVDHVHRTSSANDGDLDELVGEPETEDGYAPVADDGDLEELVREDLPDDLDAELTGLNY